MIINIRVPKANVMVTNHPIGSFSMIINIPMAANPVKIKGKAMFEFFWDIV